MAKKKGASKANTKAEYIKPVSNGAKPVPVDYDPATQVRDPFELDLEFLLKSGNQEASTTSTQDQKNVLEQLAKTKQQSPPQLSKTVIPRKEILDFDIDLDSDDEVELPLPNDNKKTTPLCEATINGADCECTVNNVALYPAYSHLDEMDQSGDDGSMSDHMMKAYLEGIMAGPLTPQNAKHKRTKVVPRNYDLDSRDKTQVKILLKDDEDYYQWDEKDHNQFAKLTGELENLKVAKEKKFKSKKHTRDESGRNTAELNHKQKTNMSKSNGNKSRSQQIGEKSTERPNNPRPQKKDQPRSQEPKKKKQDQDRNHQPKKDQDKDLKRNTETKKTIAEAKQTKVKPVSNGDTEAKPETITKPRKPRASKPKPEIAAPSSSNDQATAEAKKPRARKPRVKQEKVATQ